jgi:hypothetical protein
MAKMVGIHFFSPFSSLSSSARESTTAFYAADSGLECAMYSDVGNNFATTSQAVANSRVSCAKSQDITPDYTGDSAEGTFTFPINMNDSACAVVTIDKYFVDDPVLGLILQTTITSRGYNLGWDSDTETCDNPSPRRVERGLRITY